MNSPLLSSNLNDNTCAVLRDDLFWNFLLFSISFSIVHATVDGVLVYATAELGALLGAVSGGMLYLCYSFSSLFLAKSLLYKLKSRRAVLLGMVCLLTYVSTFLIALVRPGIKWVVCIIGSICGGFGAGIMWTAQGSYYALNSSLYIMSSNLNHDDNCEATRDTVLNSFAAYFAGIYLSSEAVCKMLITALYIIFSRSSDDDDSVGKINSWQVIAFFIFAVVAWVATACSFGILDLSSLYDQYAGNHEDDSEELDDSHKIKKSGAPLYQKDKEAMNINIMQNQLSSIGNEMSSVLMFISENKMFRYLLPYQFSFGMSSTFMGYLVYGMILDSNGKEGYIGMLSALSVLLAGSLTVPVAWYITNMNGGKIIRNMHFVMVAGASIFMICSVFPLFISDKVIASWPVIIPLVSVYGAGRSIWESSNKALVVRIFTDEDNAEYCCFDLSDCRISMSSINECANEEKTHLESRHERAFAAIYFTSGMGAAVAFLTFNFMSSTAIATTTLSVGLIALICNNIFFVRFHEDCYLQ